MNIIIDVDKDKLYKNIVGAKSHRECLMEITIESIVDDTVYEISKHGMPNFRLVYEDDMSAKGRGIIFFICYRNIKCSLPVCIKDNHLMMLDQKTRINSSVLSNLFITLASSNIKIEDLKHKEKKDEQN